ncbi:MAG: hypothetical protein H7145_24110 [Akkermansiaceae bacterium]|nr:hypothetical protein [Armatimonadota bacterium]
MTTVVEAVVAPLTIRVFGPLSVLARGTELTGLPRAAQLRLFPTSYPPLRLE